jgi:hypothetical protein
MGIPWWGYVLIVLGGIGAAATLVVRALSEATRVHHRETCGCFNCRNWRNRRDAKKRLAEIDRPKVSDSITGLTGVKEARHHISTTRLESGRKVVIGGEIYLVKNIRTDAMGYLVELRNLRTRNDVIATVAFSVADRQIWEPLPYWG